MALTTLTSLADQRSDGAPRVVLGAVVALLEGRQVVGDVPGSGSGVVGCLTVTYWRFWGSPVAALVGVCVVGCRCMLLAVGALVLVSQAGNCWVPAHSVIRRNISSHMPQTWSKYLR